MKLIVAFPCFEFCLGYVALVKKVSGVVQSGLRIITASTRYDEGEGEGK